MKGRRDKLVRIASDVRRSIQEGYDQACDVVRFLRSASGKVVVFDSDKADRTAISELDPAQIQHVIPIVFLDSYYGLIATDLQPWISVDANVGFPWVVDRNTLASILLKIETFDQLKSFLVWRRGLHGTAINEDEAVFAGFFLRHGPAEMPKEADRVQLSPDYADIFEAEYFRRQGIPVEMPPERTGPPVWSSAKRVGDELFFEIDGNLHEILNLKTGQSRAIDGRMHNKRSSGKIERNGPCPCGSGQKFKKCCLRKSRK